MNKLTQYLKSISILSLTLTTFAHAEDLSDKKLKSVKRDLNIMTTIVETAIKSQERESNIVQSMYLAKQGMVFTIGSRHGINFNYRRHNDRAAPIPPIPPLPPVAAMLSDAPMSEADIEQLEESTMAAVEIAMELSDVQMEFYSHNDWSAYTTRERSESRSEQKELQTQRRELEREARVLERKVHEIERKIRDAEYQQELDSSDKNKMKIAALEKEMAALTKSMTAVAQEINAKAETLRLKADEMRKKQIAQANAKIEATEKAISQAVCDFGSGLRSLGSEEHITFNLKGNIDKIYVFDLPSINRCADGDIDAAELLGQAIQYSI